MNINEEYAMELLLANHSHGSEIGGGYGTCFMYECQITNPERLVSALSENDIETLMKSDKRYFLSEKGMEHYRENIDLYELHRNWKYRLRLDEYFKYRKSNGVIRDFYEIAYLALKERMEKGDMDMKIRIG